MKRLFACDLDGTLLNCLHRTDSLILHGIDQVIKKENYFTIATGRNMRPDHVRMDFKNRHIFCICMNGACILDSNQQIIYEKPIPKEMIQEIVKQFPDYKLEFAGKKGTYVKSEEKAFIKNHASKNIIIRLACTPYWKKHRKDFQYEVSDETILNDEILKINWKIESEEKQKKLEQFLEKHANQIVNAPYAKGSFEITHASVDKGTAVKWLANHLHLNDDHVYVYGDGGNDIAMLEKFDNSYVPSNGSDDAKKAGKHSLANNAKYSVILHIVKNNL